MKPSSLPSFQRRLLVCGTYLVFLVAMTACSKAQESSAPSARAADTPAAPQPVQQLEVAPVIQAGSKTPTEESETPAPASPSRAQPTKKQRSGAGADHGAKQSAASAPAERARNLLDDESARAEPAYAEPPGLTQALADFDSQAETLSTTRACDEACLALESMKRTAQRICELVLDADPKERCRTARSRLEQASRDLTARCPSCR